MQKSVSGEGEGGKKGEGGVGKRVKGKREFLDLLLNILLIILLLLFLPFLLLFLPCYTKCVLTSVEALGEGKLSISSEAPNEHRSLLASLVATSVPDGLRCSTDSTLTEIDLYRTILSAPCNHQLSGIDAPNLRRTQIED